MDLQGITLEQRREILQREVSEYVNKGFLVISQTDTTAQLVKHKKFSFLWATLWFLVFGVGFLIYVFWYWSRKDQGVYLEVTSNGQIITRKAQG